MLRKLFGARKPAPPPANGGPPAPAPLDLTAESFDGEVLAAQLPALVDFWAEWCQPCKIMSAYTGFLARDYAGRLLVAALDVDEHPAVAERYAVMGLPTLILFKHGAEVDRIVGVEAYDEIASRVEALLAR
jgi:thioredoxin 1